MRSLASSRVLRAAGEDDGTKAPALVTWTQYQTQPADEPQLSRWFANGSRNGLGIVCGEVSGQLEMFEFEGRAVLEGLVPAMALAMENRGLAELWATLTGGYTELTPTGGLHLYYRVGDGPARGNLKLARRPATEAELDAEFEAKGSRKEKIKVLIETRGEGGYVVIAPTPGSHHPNGRPWTTLMGSPTAIPTISTEQRDLLHDIATRFDAMPPPPAWSGPVDRPSTGGSSVGGLRPGDDYNSRASWDDILVPEGGPGCTASATAGPGAAPARIGGSPPPPAPARTSATTSMCSPPAPSSSPSDRMTSSAPTPC